MQSLTEENYNNTKHKKQIFWLAKITWECHARKNSLHTSSERFCQKV